MENIFEHPVFARIASWVCLAVMPLFTSEVAAAQVVANADSNDEPMVSLAGQSLPVDEASRKLSRKYDLNRIGDRGVGGGLNGYSIEKEQRLGEKLAAGIERRHLSHIAQVFSEFPSLDKRLRQDRTMVSTFPPSEEYMVDTSGFEEMKAKYDRPGPELRRSQKHSTRPRLRRRIETAGENQ